MCIEQIFFSNAQKHSFSNMWIQNLIHRRAVKSKCLFQSYNSKYGITYLNFTCTKSAHEKFMFCNVYNFAIVYL